MREHCEKLIDRVGVAPSVAAAFVLLSCLIAGWNIFQQHRDAMANAEAQLSALSRAAGNQADNTLGNLDALLRDIGEQFPAGGRASNFNRVLERRCQTFGQVLGLSLVGLDGTVLYSSNAPDIGRNVAPRPFLDHFRENPEDDSLLISDPERSLGGQTAVFVRRAVRDEGGRLLAVATARIDPRFFLGFLASVQPNYRDATMTLVSPNHKVLARVPDNAAMLGRSLRDGPFIGPHLQSGLQDSIQRGRALVDDADRLAAVHSSRVYPITVTISAPIAEVLGPWRWQLMWNLGALLAVILVVGVAARIGAERQKDRHRANAALAAERDFSGSLITALPGLFYLFDADGRFLRWNANFEAVTGRDATQMASTHPLDLFEGDDKAPVAESIAKVLNTGGATVEGTIVSTTGERHPHYFTGVRLYVDGRPCVMGVGQDISELKQLHHSLERSNEDLRQFAYVASHQLQEPLRVIASYVQLLARRYEGQLDPEADVFIGFAVGGVKRMSALIHDLLAFARVSTHVRQPAPVNLGDLTEQVLHDLSLAITNAGAEMVVEGPLPTVSGDESLLGTLLQNIIGNAIKYRHPDRNPKVVVSVRRSGGFWDVAVADNGIGIAAEHFAKIFELFQRLHRAADYEGTGIGLAVSRKIVEWHGGRIWVESREGDGTTFHFTLPA